MNPFSKAVRMNAIDRNRKRPMKIMIYFIIMVLILAIDMPFLNMLATSMKPRAGSAGAASWLLGHLDIRNFIYVLQRTSFPVNVLNSMLVSSITVILCIFISSLAGYAISRFRSRAFRHYSILLLVLQMFPSVLLLIPLYLTFKTINLIDTPASVIICYVSFNLPFSTLMLKSFFDSIPFEMEQSAMIDGCDQFQSFCRMVLPISLPGLAAVGIFAFLNSWNEFMVANIFLRTNSIKTLSLGLNLFIQQFTSDWSALMAASIIAIIPSVIFLTFAQKYLINGLTAGSVKE